MQVNEAVVKEYQSIEQDIDLLKGDTNELNQDIDTFINTFSVIDQIEKDVTSTEENIELIFKTIQALSSSSLT